LKISQNFSIMKMEAAGTSETLVNMSQYLVIFVILAVRPSDYGILGCDAVSSCREVSTFQGNMLLCLFLFNYYCYCYRFLIGLSAVKFARK
jgi:hypothetical protein